MSETKSIEITATVAAPTNDELKSPPLPTSLTTGANHKHILPVRRERSNQAILVARASAADKPN